jgi:hypothetical protein
MLQMKATSYLNAVLDQETRPDLTVLAPSLPLYKLNCAIAMLLGQDID